MICMICRRIIAVLVVVLFIVLCGCTDLLSDNRIIPLDEVATPSAEELTALYNANKDAFLSAANAVLGSEPLRKQIEDRDIRYFCIACWAHKEFFTEEAWYYVTAIFGIAHLHRITRYISGAVCFEFLTNPETNTTAYLYYFPEPSDRFIDLYLDIAYTISYHSINDNWWIRVT